jgi:ABC-type phosphate/phosphonate transport system substrate-binding protein
MVSSLFKEVPESQVDSGKQIFSALMREQIGLANELAQPMIAAELAQQLACGRLDIAIFQGVEFAWAREKHASLHPLLVIVNRHLYRQAHLLTRRDGPVKSVMDLKGRVAAIPAHSREHCDLFLERLCRDQGHAVVEFFARVLKPPTVEDALDDTVDGTIDAAVVDGVSLQAYQRRKPARFARLKDLLKSEAFPDSVVAYRPGALDPAILERCRKGLLDADKHIKGQLLLMLWRVTAFEPVPQDFDGKLTAIGKAYRAPPELLSGGARAPTVTRR